MNQCIWTENFDPDYWETSCGQAFTLIDGTLEDNHIRFCAFCGREIAAHAPARPTGDVATNAAPRLTPPSDS